MCKQGYKTKIDKEEINLLPLKKFEGQIHLIDTPQAIEQIVTSINGNNILGFDTETKPSFKKGKSNNVSVLQLSISNQAYIIRVNKTGFTNTLKKILASPDILKIGVALHDDIKALKKLHNFEPQGFVDLQKEVDNFGIEDKGLKKLTANILGFRISKHQQTSNWEAPVLTQQQLDYAATDAWVCLEIYKKLFNIND